MTGLKCVYLCVSITAASAALISPGHTSKLANSDAAATVSTAASNSPDSGLDGGLPTSEQHAQKIALNVASNVTKARPLSQMTYETLSEPRHSAQLAGLKSQYGHAPSDDLARDLVFAYLSDGRTQDALDLALSHEAADPERFFNVRQEALTARLKQVSRLEKLSLAKQLLSLCEVELARAPGSVAALECLVKFHAKAPAVAGGVKAMSSAYLSDLRAVRPSAADLLRAQQLFRKDAAQARTLVDRALEDDGISDEGLVVAAMAYGSWEDWAAMNTALARISDTSPAAQLRNYQLGRLCAEQKTHLDEGEQALLQFLSGNTVRGGVDYRGPAHWRLGQIFAHTQRTALARQAMERALDLMPSLRSAQQDLKVLKKSGG